MRTQLAITTLLCSAATVAAPAHAADASRATCDGRTATIVGTGKADRLVGTMGPDVIYGGGGADVIVGLSGDDRLCGGPGNDTVKAGRGRDIIDGGTGNDRLEGQKGMDTFVGDGRQRADGADVYLGGPDKDRFELASPGHDRFLGGEGNDQINLFGDVSGLRAFGGAGRDSFRVSSYYDITVAGGPGRDSISVTGYTAAADQRLTVDYRVGEITNTYYDSMIRVSGIEATEVRMPEEEFTLAAYVYGTPGDDEITARGDGLAPLTAFGYGGDDVFQGTAGGDDTLDGGAGTDTADGDDGFDTCISIERAVSCESAG